MGRLIHEVQTVCLKLAKDRGWVELFALHGLDIRASDLEPELRKELHIKHAFPGFEDFAGDGIRGIEPSRPSHSLLYHALASPNVTSAPKEGSLTEVVPLKAFPSLRDLEIVENYIFATQQTSVASLMAIHSPRKLAIGVFAYEYRQGANTVHRRHADLCFSRTGLARVGTAEEFYDATLRGFVPFRDQDDFHTIRVLPARYAPFIAVQVSGNKETIGPLHYLDHNPEEDDEELAKADKERLFWVPVHKLFSGTECVRDRRLEVELRARHRNEKLRRVHLEFLRRNQNAGWQEDDLNVPPFVIEENIADLSEIHRKDQYGTGVLVPYYHPLVEEARQGSVRVTFLVPTGSKPFDGSLRLDAENDARHAPEFVHVRHKVENGKLVMLNDLPDDIHKTIRNGEYRAQHYIDHTADGFVEATCAELAVDFPRNIPAYSLVTPPDFFCVVSQTELLEWTERSLPEKFRETIWNQLPMTLADARVPPNIQFAGANFRAEDTTVTAVISMPIRPSTPQMQLADLETKRHQHLPDSAAGKFAPGWDVSLDSNDDDVTHLAAYGLGSPFPEDAKLCAAMSAFWPAVAPDATRTFPPGWVTVAPLTDDEIGMTGKPSWDGVVGPQKVGRGSRNLEYADSVRTDYVENALAGKFSLRPTGTMTSVKYRERVLAMALAYEALGVRTEDPDESFKAKAAWTVLSFQEVDSKHRDCKAAQKSLGSKLRFTGSIYRFAIYKAGKRTDRPTKRTVEVEIREMYNLLVDSRQAVLRRVLPEERKTWHFPDV